MYTEEKRIQNRIQVKGAREGRQYWLLIDSLTALNQVTREPRVVLDFRFVVCCLRWLAHCLICSSVIENHFYILQLGSV